MTEAEKTRIEEKLPVLRGKIESGMVLRQAAGEGSLGDVEIHLSTTAGVSGFSLIVEVEPPGHDRVYAHYNLAPLVEEIAKAVIDA